LLDSLLQETMSSKSNAGSRRGRPPKPKTLVAAAAGNFHTNEDEGCPPLKHSFNQVQGDSVTKQSQSKDDSKDGDTRKRLIAEVENVMTQVNRSLKAKNVKTAGLLNDNEKLTKKVNRLEADNIKLAKMIKTEAQSVSEKQKEENNVLLRQLEDKSEDIEKCEFQIKALQRQLKEKGEKLEKLANLIDPLREKVKEQEDLKEQLNQANIENKSLHVANEEFKAALNAKEKQLQNANQLFARSRKSLSEEVSDKRQMLDSLQKRLEAEEGKLQNQKVEVSHRERLAEERHLQIGAEKKEIAEEKIDIQQQKKNIEDDQVMLDTRWEELNVLKLELSSKKKKLEDDQQALEEQKKDIEDDKMTIDSEWGEIMTRKEELKRLERSENDMVEKQEELAKIEADNNSLQVQLSHIQEQLGVCRDASKKEVSGLRSAREKEEIARKVLEEEMLLKNVEITALRDELLSSKIRCENLVNSNINKKVELEKIIEEKDHELVTLKQQVPGRSFVKRKMCEQEPKDVSNKKSKLSDELMMMMMMNTEDMLDYLPSDIETGIEEADGDVDSSDNSPVNEDDSIKTLDSETTKDDCVPENSAGRMLDNTGNADVGESDDAVNDSSNALKQIEEFEHFIKSKRMRDLGGKENHPNIGSSDEYQVSKTSTVEKKLDVPTNVSSKDVNTKDKKSVRDVFESSDEGSESSQPTTSQEGCGRYQTGIQDNELNLPPPTLPLPLKPSADIAPVVSNSPARTSNKAMAMVSKPAKAVLVVKDIKTLMPPCLDQDVIIPRDPSISDPVLDISDTDARELEILKKLEEKIEREVKFNVADVVKNVLDKFYKQENGIESREEFERMAADLTNKFKEDIVTNYRMSHDTLQGVLVTKADRNSIIDQIIFYFEVKGVVSKYLRQCSVVTSSASHPKVTTLAAQFSKEIEESYMTVHNTLAGMKLTEDSKLWIKNELDVQCSVRH